MGTEGGRHGLEGTEGGRHGFEGTEEEDRS